MALHPWHQGARAYEKCIILTVGTPHEAIWPGILELPLIANETIELPTIHCTCKTVGSLSRNITSRSHVILQFNEVGSH